MNFKFTLTLIIFSALVSCEVEPKQKEIMPEPKPYQPTYSLDFLLGKFDPKSHEEFVLIDEKYADRNDRMMQRQAYEAFVIMFEAALEEGIELKIISATRNFEYQSGIWSRKWSGQTLLEGKYSAQEIQDETERARAIMRWSAMPGTSRHHWGTDIDINALNNAYFESGDGLKVFNWLQKNASKFGYCRPYTEKGEQRPEGYEEEKWHWSYLPLSKKMTRDMEYLFTDEILTDFDGHEAAKSIGAKKNYILGIDKSCL